MVAQLEAKLKGINIYLVGMMGAGKTTVGHLLAQQLHYRFFDTDAIIEQVTGQTINAIFTSAGEDAFRQVEAQALAELSAYTRLVLATGGGIVLRRENWGYLQQGLVIWLDVPVEILLERLQGDRSRPLLASGDADSKLRQLLAQRQKLYAQADLKITASGSETPAETVERILAAIPQVLKSPPVPPSHN